MTEIALGPHLLGRQPSPPDERDWQLAPFLAGDPLEIALAALRSSHAAKATKDWAAVATERIVALAPPAPPPSPAPDPYRPPEPSPAGDVIWADPRDVLDQGNTGHCVGFGWAQWSNTDPIEGNLSDPDGHAVYYECKVLDGEAGAENGSYVRTGAKAMQNRGRLSGYAFAKNASEVKAWILGHGPVVLGTDWHHSMFNPDKNGLVSVAGSIDGGHCYLAIGDRPEIKAVECLNSWGHEWAVGGRFFIRWDDLDRLLAADGEAVAAVELPL